MTPEIKVLTPAEELVLSCEEGIIPVAFNVNVDWKAEIKEAEAQQWCGITPSKGGQPGDNVLNVICIENKGTDNRTATVVIKAMDAVHELVITQLQKDVLVLTAKKDYDIAYQGDTLKFNVSHNLDLKVRSDVDWIKEVQTKGLVEEARTFIVEPNAGEARTGKITFTADPFEEVITVNQAAWVLEFNVDPAEDKAFDADGGEHKITVASNVEYTVKLEEVDWLKMSVDNNEYVFTAEPNSDLKARNTTVRISPKSAKYIQAAKVITLSQKGAGAELNVSESEKRVTYLEQKFELTVKANIDYELSFLKAVDGEYVDMPDAENWLSYTASGNVYTFSVPENASWEERSLILCFAPKDAAYSDMITYVPVYQYGYAFKMWSRQISTIEGYDAGQKVRLAMYGDRLLLANTTKVYVVDPVTGEIESTIQMPDGVYAHSVLVDDAGNLMIAADGDSSSEIKLYLVPDPTAPEPAELLAYHTGSYYGSNTGNFRVKGNIMDDAVITAVVSDGQDGENIEDGAVLIWEVTDGEIGGWKWTNVPYTAWNVSTLCCSPVGTSLSDGLFYIGYGGDYNLYYTSAPVLNPVKAEVEEGEDPYYVESTDWQMSYVTGSSWMENYNCISTAEWKGNKYAAIVMGCHFDYDMSDAVLLDVNDPAAAKHLYTYFGNDDAAWDWDWDAGVGVNNSWTGLGTYSDVLLVPTDDAILMIYVDSNYGTFTCVAVMK